MAVAYELLRDFSIPVIAHRYVEKDVMLYALGLGLGGDPLNEDQLGFVYEKDLKVLPTFGGVLGYPGFWPKAHPELGITWQRLLNGEQGIEIHRPFPPSGEVVGSMTIERIVDKGVGKGMLIYTRRDVRDQASGDLLCTVSNTMFCRADGGFGGPTAPGPAAAAIPDRASDQTIDWPTLPQAALIYRLSGDFNPLHAEPAVARQGGFDRPILHGAATWGIAGCALLQALCGGDPARFRSYQARFTSPVYPGETLRVEVWLGAPGHASFRVAVPARGVTVLDNGVFSYQTESP